VYNLSLKIALD